MSESVTVPVRLIPSGMSETSGILFTKLQTITKSRMPILRTDLSERD